MTYVDLNAVLADRLQAVMIAEGWIVLNKEAGQVHILGWGYTIQWQKANETVTLNYKELQGKAQAQLLVSSGALPEIETLINTRL